MKNALLLIIKFIVAHIVFLLIASAVYFLYLQSTQITAGTPVGFLPLSSIFPVLPFILACASIIAGFHVQGSCVRTKAKLLSQIISAALVAVSWLAVIPACAVLSARFFPSERRVFPQEEISAGYFRPYKNGVLFTVNAGKTVDGVFLQTSAVESPQIIHDVNAADLKKEPYSDVLVADTIPTPFFLSRLAKEAFFFADIGRAARRDGFLPWLCFASMCLPFAAISALSRAGSWKLKNITFMLFVFAAIVIINKLYYTYDFFGTASRRSLEALDVPHAVLNALLAIIILLLGILATVITSRKTIEDDE